MLHEICLDTYGGRIRDEITTSREIISLQLAMIIEYLILLPINISYTPLGQTLYMCSSTCSHHQGIHMYKEAPPPRGIIAMYRLPPGNANPENASACLQPSNLRSPPIQIPYHSARPYFFGVSGPS